MYSRAPLFSTTHISVGLDAMMMCFIGCECDEIRKVTIVFFFSPFVIIIERSLLSR